MAIYWERYGWVAPDMDDLRPRGRAACSPATGRKLVYLKRPAPDREPGSRRCSTASATAACRYKAFETPEELEELLAHDLSSLLSERFQTAAPSPPTTAARPAPLPVGHHVLRRARRGGRPTCWTASGATTCGSSRSSARAASARPAWPSRWPSRLAAELPDGVVYVPARGRRATRRSSTEAILRALDVHERGAESAAARWCAPTSPTAALLLVLDNFEHLLDGGGAGRRAPRATTTGREGAGHRAGSRCGCAAEHEVLVSSLPIDRRRAASSSTGRGPAGALDLDGDELDAVRAHLRSARRRAARDRAGRGAHPPARPPATILERLGRQPRLPGVGPARPARPPAGAALDDRVEPRPPRPGRSSRRSRRSAPSRAASPSRPPAERDRRRRRARRPRLAGRQEPPAGGGARRASCGCGCSGWSVTSRSSSSSSIGGLDACRARHAEHYRAMALAASGPLRTAEQTRWLDRLEPTPPTCCASLDWWIGAAAATTSWPRWSGTSGCSRGCVATCGRCASCWAGSSREPDLGGRAAHPAPGGGRHPRRVRRRCRRRSRCSPRPSSGRARRGSTTCWRPRRCSWRSPAARATWTRRSRCSAKLGDDWGAAAALCAKAWVHVSLDAFDGADDVFDEAYEAAGTHRGRPGRGDDPRERG